MRSIHKLYFFIIILNSFLFVTASATDISTVSDLPVPMKTPFAFEPFGPGPIKPTGWLLDWAEAAAAGITGHLDEWAPTFGMGWKGVSFEARGVGEEGTGWPLEQCAYWLDGLVRLAYILNDSNLIAKARSRLDPVVEGTLSGNRSFIYWRPMDHLNERFDNWAHSHMGRALVAYYQATGDKQILDALVRVYSTYPLPFPDPRSDGSVCGSVNLDPLLETYRMSGDRSIIENALAYISSPDFTSMVNEYNSQEPADGHSVIYYENIRVPSVAYPWTGNHEHIDATINMLLKSEKMNCLPIGLISGEEYNSGIGSTRNIETCDVAASAWTINWLLRITGDRQFADRIEKIFFNAGPAPVARDFKTMSYYQSPNRLMESMIAEPPRNPPGGYESYRFSNLGHKVLCCVGNINRVIPNYIMHMWMKTPDNGIAATLYGPSRLSTHLAGVLPIELECVTDYPFEEDITILVKSSNEIRFPLHLRIPGWCSNPGITVNGIAVDPTIDSKGFVIIFRTWQNGDEVQLHFPMPIVIVQGRETNYPRIQYYAYPGNRPLSNERSINNPYASVLYGPLLFALPIRDITPDIMDTETVWNYALDVSPGEEDKIQIARIGNMPDHWHWQLDSPLRLRIPARQFDWKPDNLRPLPAEPIKNGTRCMIELVPYGVTKFRISMFPVTSDSWNGGQ